MKKFTQLLFCFAIICFSANYSYAQWTTVANPQLTNQYARINDATPRLILNNTGASDWGGIYYQNDFSNEMYQYYNVITNVVSWGNAFPNGTNNAFHWDIDLPDVGATGTNGGFTIGDPDGLRLTFDNNEFAVKNGTANSTMSINHDGGGISFGTNSNSGDFSFGLGADLFIDNSAGRVGIGTSTPVAPLDISSNNEAITLSGSNSYLSFRQAGVFRAYLQATSTDLILNNSGGTGLDDLILRTDGDDVLIDAQNEFRITTGGATEDVIVDAVGNVGLGTSTPAAKLHLNNGNLRIDNAGDLEFYNAGSRLASWFVNTSSIEFDGLNDIDLGMDAAGTGEVYFNTNDGTRRMTIIQDGSVGIGTTTPTKALEVIGQLKLTNTLANNTDKQSLMLMDHYSGGATDFAYFKAQSSSTQNSVNFGGGAGANYAATSLSFFTANNTTTTNGDVRLRFRFDGRSIFQTDNSTGSTYPTDHNVWGSAGKPGGGNWSGISDRRLKKDVREYTDGLDEIMRIEPVFYSYDENEVNGTHGSEFVGIIAQDMQKIAPYTVTEVEWANEEHRSPYKTVLTYDGTAIPYMLINAVKAQQEEIQSQATIIAEKDAQIQANVESITALEDKVNKLFALLDKGVENITTETIKINQVNAQIDITKDVAQLEQNIPNPFNENTVINYFIPSGTKTAAMNILDENGRLIKSIKLTETGSGQLNLTTNNLPSGTFIYQLIADNVKIDSKQMISIK